MKRIICTLLAIFALVGFASAQSSLGIFSGRVLDGGNNNEPLIGATIKVKNESTGFQTGGVTDIDGKFKIEELPLGGPYTVTVSYIGYKDRIYKNYRLNMSDHIVIPDIVMSEDSKVLQEVVVDGFSYKSSRDRVGSSVRIDSNLMDKLPSASRNFQSFAELTPMTKGVSVAGAKNNMMGLMLDGVSNRAPLYGGMGEGAFPISMEAIREFEVVTNTYSVADGRGGAGAIKAVTKSGDNTFHASAWGYYTGGSLSGVNVTKTTENGKDIYKKGNKGESDITQFGVSLSGPIIKDKLHYFILYDRYNMSQPWRMWDFDNSGATLSDAENVLGITKDNMDLLVKTMEDKYGVPKTKQYGTMTVNRLTQNIFGRLDWNINDIHSLTFRYSYHQYLQPDKAPGSSFFTSQYKGNEQDHNVLLNLKSRFNPTLRNDLKLSLSTLSRTGYGVYPRVPMASIYVTSKLPNGTEKKTQVNFGSQRWSPEDAKSQQVQLVDNLTYIKGNVKYLFGMDLQSSFLHENFTHDQNGVFTYYSLENFLNNDPDEFQRKIPFSPRAGKFVNNIVFASGLYGEASFSPMKNLDVTLGLRWDGTYLPSKPAADPKLEKEFGIRSDVAPFDWNGFQPRLFAMWDINGKGTDILKFGAGLFKSEFTTQALTFAKINSANNYKFVHVFKNNDPNGVAIPKPDFPSYYKDFNNVPGKQWLENSGMNVDEIPEALHIIDKKLKAPTTFKTNITYTKYITDKWMVTGGFYLNLIWDSYMLKNLNLRKDAAWHVDAEGGRDIYVPADKINSNGMANYQYARQSDKFDNVMMFTNADWMTKSWYFVLESAYRIKDGELRFSYTYGQSKGGVEYNNGDPKDFYMTGKSYYGFPNEMKHDYSTDDMRHKLVLTFVSPTWKGFSIGINAQAHQWERFNSFVNIDQNGDNSATSANQDLSFIFDPASPNCPAEIKSDLEYVWQHTSSEYRKFLNENKGTFAKFNSGLQPWNFKLDMSVKKDFTFAKKHHIEARVDFFNILNLFNYKWGGRSYISDTNLYQIKGFDPATKKYTYSVNKNAGQKRYEVGLDQLYRVQFGLKYNF